MLRRTYKEVPEEDRERQKRLKLFYDLIWAGLKEKRCQQCGTPLGKEHKSWMFDHLLEKADYPEIEYELWNIFICCFQCHGKKTNGFPGDKHKAAIEKAKEHYKQLKMGDSVPEQE